LVTDKKGNDFFLYHAYSTKSTVYPGRQGLLDKVNWGNDYWPTFEKNAPSIRAQMPQKNNPPANLPIADEFNKPTLANTWQWSVTQVPGYTLANTNNGQLILNGSPDKIGSYLGQRTPSGKYTATAAVQVDASAAGILASLVAIGDSENAIGLGVNQQELVLWETKKNKTTLIAKESRPQGEQVLLRMTSETGEKLNFSWSVNGITWIPLEKGQGLDGGFLPPWDRGVRVGLAAKGPENTQATFNYFILNNR
jgi:hypothetical protein